MAENYIQQVKMLNNNLQQVSTSKEMKDDRYKMLKEFDDTKAGVKGLVDAGIDKIPPIFVLPPELVSKTPSSGKPDIKIPVIDIQDMHENTSRRQQILEEIRYASETWGFFQLVNHGIPQDILDEMIEGVRRFHEQPTETKMELYSRDITKKVKFNSNFDLYQSKAANWRDSLTCIMGPDPPTPEELPASCRDVLTEYSSQVRSLGVTILELVSESLGLKSDYLNEIECSRGTYLVCHYYPSCPEPDRTVGIAPHTDPDFFTILLQDHIGGLQIFFQDQWIDIEPAKGALVVNLGDFMQLISNDKYKSAMHRVLSNQIGPRISVACLFTTYFQPSNKLYGPIKELLSENNPAKFRETTMIDYMTSYNNLALGVAPPIDKFRL